LSVCILVYFLPSGFCRFRICARARAALPQVACALLTPSTSSISTGRPGHRGLQIHVTSKRCHRSPVAQPLRMEWKAPTPGCPSLPSVLYFCHPIFCFSFYVLVVPILLFSAQECHCDYLISFTFDSTGVDLQFIHLLSCPAFQFSRVSLLPCLKR
jgi:hypothetical protein